MFKKLTLVLLAVLFFAGTALAATPGSNQSPGRGEIVQMPYQSDPPKRFRIVRYIGPSDSDGILADSIVVWDTTQDDGVTVDTTTTSRDTTVAGIIVIACLTQDTAGNTAVQDIGRDNWSWLQTYGKSQVDLSSDGAVTVKQAMGTGTTAGGATNYLASTSDPLLQGFAGFFFDSAASGATDVEVFVRCE